MALKSFQRGGLTVLFPDQEQETAERIGGVCQRSLELIEKNWRLSPPKDLFVCLMTSWLSSTLGAASLPWRIILVVTLPLWGLRARRGWPVVGGWTMRIGRRQVVGVKPPRLLLASDSRIGQRIFVPQHDPDRKLALICGHELTHACVAHLRLPSWLNEGLAMVTMDLVAGEPAVLAGTAETLGRAPAVTNSRRLPRFTGQDADSLVAIYIAGYWRTRYFEETRPGLLAGLLARRRPPVDGDWLALLATAVGVSRKEFARNLDGWVAAHFAGKGSRVERDMSVEKEG